MDVMAAIRAALNPNNSHAIFTKFLLTHNEELTCLSEMRKNGQPYSDRVDYVYKLMEEDNLFPDIAAMEEEKSDIKAVEFRQEGNNFFKRGKFIDAVALYSKSMCYAASKENISIALSNRSAAFFEMEMFRECLESIRLAREFDLPQRLAEKMAEREAKCKDGRQKVQAEVLVPKIGLPVNEKIPFLAKCLALRENSTFGRHIVTEKAIPAGTIVAIEEPFCKILSSADKYMRCVTCLAEVPYLLFPCENCIHTMFCSKECQEKALKTFHAIECPISGALFEIFLDSLRLTFRSIISAFLAFPYVETMATAVQKIEAEKKNVFNFDWTQELTSEDLYTPIHNLATNEHHRDENYQLHNYVPACLMLKMLQGNSPVFRERYLASDVGANIFKNIACRHLLICITNAVGIENVMESIDDELEESRACSFLSGFLSLLSHSCAPNTAFIEMGSAIGIVTNKNISAGQQITFSYGFDFHTMDIMDRQMNLWKRYCFNCECVACAKDFPEIRGLPGPRNVPRLTTSALYGCIRSYKVAEKSFKKARDYICKYGHLYPIKQLLEAEQQLAAQLNILLGNVPLKLREQVRLST